MMKSIDLSIIIVNFNTKFLLEGCLRSVDNSDISPFTVETIVVDNASSDGSSQIVEKKFPNATLIKLPHNIGFAAGNNVGLKRAHGSLLLLLNSDTQLSKDTLKSMIEFMDKYQEAAAATCKLDLTSGQMDPACHRGFPTPWAALTYFLGLEKLFPRSTIFGQYHQGFKDLNKSHEIDSPSGAFFLVRRDIIDRVGLLDEDYFMYGEDLDWAYRMKEAGFKIFFNPETSAFHYKRQSGRAHADETLRRQTEKYFYQTMKLFYQKHFAKKYGWFITQLVLLGIKLRSLV